MVYWGVVMRENGGGVVGEAGEDMTAAERSSDTEGKRCCGRRQLRGTDTWDRRHGQLYTPRTERGLRVIQLDGLPAESWVERTHGTPGPVLWRARVPANHSARLEPASMTPPEPPTTRLGSIRPAASWRTRATPSSSFRFTFCLSRAQSPVKSCQPRSQTHKPTCRLDERAIWGQLD